jgi:hypothetical protein
VQQGGPPALGAGRTGIGRRVWEPLGTPSTRRAQEQILADLGFARDCEALWRLGPRLQFELLAELGRTHLIRSAVEITVPRYVNRLSPEKRAGRRGSAPGAPPIRALAGGRR